MRLFTVAICFVAVGAIALSCGPGTDDPGDTGVRDIGADATTADSTTRRDTGDDSGESADDSGPDGDAIRGRLQYEDRVFGPEGFTGEIALRPARAAQVALFSGPRQVAMATCDEEGRFLVRHEEPLGSEVRVRVLARAAVGDHTVQTQSHGGRVYFEERTLTIEEDNEVDIIAAADALGGAFNIVDVALDAIRLYAPYVGEAAPTLAFGWGRGESWPCGSCYADDVVKLGGQFEDPDEYDDDIILHEQGHYFVDHYSRDSSPGGQHRDRQVDPKLAYGEGIAYFFTIFVTGRPVVVDNFEGSVRTIDFDRYLQNGGTRPGFVGTDNGTIGGDHREELVGGIMWDAFDAADPAEPFDTVELGVDGAMALLVDHFGNPGHPNQGPLGLDLSDLLWALQCVSDVPREAVQALADDREYPWRAPESCP